MHRTPLLNLIADYESAHPDESETIDRFRDFIDRRPDCFDRSLEEGHITGSAWVVDRYADHVLLTHHRKLNIWVQLGGHADGNPNVHEVAFKEAEEESGLDQLTIEKSIFDLDIHLIPERKNEPEHWHYDVRFVINHSGDGNYIVSEESLELAWIEIEKLDAITREKSMHRMRRKWMENYSL